MPNCIQTKGVERRDQLNSDFEDILNAYNRRPSLGGDSGHSRCSKRALSTQPVAGLQAKGALVLRGVVGGRGRGGARVQAALHARRQDTNLRHAYVT